MAKEIVWSAIAVEDRNKILAYWINHNHSKLYSIKLDKLFREAVKLIAEYPFIGKPTDVRNIKAKKVRDYYILYTLKSNQIHILTIWDTRQDPVEMEERLK